MSIPRKCKNNSRSRPLLEQLLSHHQNVKSSSTARRPTSSLACGLVLLLALQSSCARKEVSVSKSPILIDKDAISGLGLQKKRLRDEPERLFFQRRLYKGKVLSVYMVSSESGVARMNPFPFDEYVHVLHGEVEVRPSNGDRVQRFYSGIPFFARKGFRGEWEIKAGNHLHYELSVVSSSRSDGTEDSVEHVAFALSDLSVANDGTSSNESSRKQLASGTELSVYVELHPAGSIKSGTFDEQVVYVRSGKIAIKDLNTGASQAFYTGDYFVVPQGFKGIWVNEGHSVVKYISIMKSHRKDEG